VHFREEERGGEARAISRRNFILVVKREGTSPFVNHTCKKNEGGLSITLAGKREIHLAGLLTTDREVFVTHKESETGRKIANQCFCGDSHPNAGMGDTRRAKGALKIRRVQVW